VLVKQSGAIVEQHHDEMIKLYFKATNVIHNFW